MCGFIGYITDKNLPNEIIINNKFNYYFEELKNRGPDFSQKKKFFLGNKLINIGFCRLSIQDLSHKANKIFCDNESLLLFNGEIYNYKDIKSSIEIDNNLETNTDTEVLFYFLKKRKFSQLEKLRGIFSIVFFDLKNNIVYCARDVTGTKPLYYLLNNDGFFFSSEAWFLYSLSQKKINQIAFNHYINFGFVPTEHTLVQNVKKIKPSSLITYNIINKKLETLNYFSLEKNKREKLPDNNIANEIIIKSIKSNLNSDVKMGTFLSGGVDSSTVTLIGQQYNSSLESFTTVFKPEKSFKKFNIDYNYAKKLSNEYDIKLHTIDIDYTKKDLNDFYRVAEYFDEPVSNLNFLNSYWQSKQARELGVKVILTGDGADEMFCGYDKYINLTIAENLKFLSSFSNKIKKLNPNNKGLIPNIFYKIFNDEEYFQLFTPNFKINNNDHFDFFKDTYFESNLDILNYFDTKYWLPNESNYKLDKCTMINSVEARVPFQDLEIIKNFFFVPNKKKISFFNRKFILKNLKILPNYIKKRKKIGWFNPETKFLENNLDEIVKKSISKKTIDEQGIFNYLELNNFFSSFKHRGYLIKRQITTILLFQIWYNKLIRLY